MNEEELNYKNMGDEKNIYTEIGEKFIIYGANMVNNCAV